MYIFILPTVTSLLLKPSISAAAKIYILMQFSLLKLCFEFTQLVSSVRADSSGFNTPDNIA